MNFTQSIEIDNYSLSLSLSPCLSFSRVEGIFIPLREIQKIYIIDD